MPNKIYNQSQLIELKKLDDTLKAYIENSPIPDRNYDTSFFVCVTRTLIGQLISTKSAKTIFLRLENLLGEVNYDNFINTDKDLIISCGIYEKKYYQILTIAQDIKANKLSEAKLLQMSDKEVLKTLISYPGIGEWSAEMIMLFGLRHQDILSFKDFGIVSGIKKVYKLEDLDKKAFLKIKERLSPYGSLASLYFWQAHTKE